MSIGSLCDFHSSQPARVMVHIRQIEVFVIPALAVDANGSRVCLRITSNRGYGWSELFIDESETKLDMKLWKQQLSPYVGRFLFPSLTEQITAHVHLEPVHDQRAIYLFTNALHQLKFLPDSSSYHHSFEESILKQRAVAYLSM